MKRTETEEWVDMGLSLAALCASLVVAATFMLSSGQALHDEAASAWRTQATQHAIDR